MKIAFLVAAGIAAVALSGEAARAQNPQAATIVVELFTSQGCSSCPPADAYLAELKASRPDLLTLDFHVDYWNGNAWTDRFSSPEATRRQRDYARLLGMNEVYTPEIVVAGAHAAVGSDSAAVTAAIDAARAEAGMAPSLSLARDGARLRAEIGPGAGRGTLWLVGYDAAHDTQIGGGENGGRQLHEVNVVRSLIAAGAWDGRPQTLALSKPWGERAALLIQRDDGRILAAAVAS